MLSERVIKKHVAIIHAFSQMSTIQRKIVNALLFEAMQTNNRLNHEESVAYECQMSLAQLRKTIQFNSHNTQYLKEAIDGLASLKIEWNLLKDKVPSNISFLNLRVLHGAPTFYDDYTFNFSFHKLMLAFVNHPAIYGAINLDLQAQFESKYSHSLYENATRFANLHKDKIISLDIFRKLLGVDLEKYQRGKELNRNVIEPALEEVNDRADFTVQLKPVKAGRKCAAYAINVRSKQKSAAPSKSQAAVTPSDDHVSKELHTSFGKLTTEILSQITKNYSDAYILEKITYTKNHAKKLPHGFYPLPYLLSALKHDYKEPQPRSIPANSSVIIPADTVNASVDENEQQAMATQHMLLSEIEHWKKILSYAEMTNHPERIKEIQVIILNAEQKLRMHTKGNDL